MTNQLSAPRVFGGLFQAAIDAAATWSAIARRYWEAHNGGTTPCGCEICRAYSEQRQRDDDRREQGGRHGTDSPGV